MKQSPAELSLRTPERHPTPAPAPERVAGSLGRLALDLAVARVHTAAVRAPTVAGVDRILSSARALRRRLELGERNVSSQIAALRDLVDQLEQTVRGER